MKRKLRIFGQERGYFNFTKDWNHFGIQTDCVIFIKLVCPNICATFCQIYWGRLSWMEERQKTILQRNRTNLVRDLDPSILYDGLLEKAVFTQDMIDEIKVCQLCGFRLMLYCLWENVSIQYNANNTSYYCFFYQSSGTRRDQARQLVRDLETRGSRAFPLFLECLQETGQRSLAELLQNGAPAVQLQPATPTQLDRPVVQPLPVCEFVMLY